MSKIKQFMERHISNESCLFELREILSQTDLRVGQIIYLVLGDDDLFNIENTELHRRLLEFKMKLGTDYVDKQN